MDEHAAKELREQLNEGLARSGMTAEQAAVRSELGRTTVSQTLNSTERVPTARTVAALARALRLDEQSLLRLRKAAAEGESSAADGSGRLIRDCDPLDLEVHPAGPVRDAARALPGYVRRAHDEALSTVIDAAAAGHSTMAVLVGSSSTGKTRACWEAIQPLAAGGWQVWHPYDPTRVDAALSGLNRVSPCTVVWLNEAQHYLDAGEQMAAAIHRLLTEPKHAPVLVLATLWPDYDVMYTHRPQPGQPDPHARTRELLAGRRIEVAAEFDDASLRKAENLAAAGDRLWAEVLAHDHRRRLAQHLAGAPELVRRYNELSAAARALTHAAMDARRLGVGPHLALAFLADAAPDYLNDDDLHILENEDWLERALSDLAKPVHGDLAPLRRIHSRRRRPRPTAGTTETGLTVPPEPRYRLADYLDQFGRRERRMSCPPLSFWEAAHTFITNPDELASLGRAARDRHRLFWAKAHYQRAAEVGNASVLVRLAEMRELDGDRDGAEAFYQRAADTGDTSAMVWLAQMRELDGDRDEAEALYHRAADAENISALVRLARIRERDGEDEKAEALYQRAASAGNTIALTRLAKIRERAGDHSEAELLAQRAAMTGDVTTLGELALMREQVGSRDEAELLALRAADAGDTVALRELAAMREGAGDREGAERLALCAADTGNALALAELAVMREEAGEHAEAERLAQAAAEFGNTIALVQIAEMREQAGNPNEAEAVYQCAANLGNASALVRLVGMREEAGDHDEAEILYQRAGDTGDAVALGELAIMRERTGDRNGAERLALRAAHSGNTIALVRLAEMRERDGYPEEAERLALCAGDASVLVLLAGRREEAGDHANAEALYQRAADTGNTSALLLLAERRERAGERDEAERLALRAADTRVLGQLALMREEAGDHGEAERLALRAADAGDTSAIAQLALVRQVASLWPLGLEPDGTPSTQGPMF